MKCYVSFHYACMAFSHEVYTLRINLYSHKNINFLKYILLKIIVYMQC